MATEDAYEGAIRVMLESDEVDAVIVGIVPLTAALLTAPEELADERALAVRLRRLFAHTAKPLVAVVDPGPRYDPLARALRSAACPCSPRRTRRCGRSGGSCATARGSRSERTGETRAVASSSPCMGASMKARFCRAFLVRGTWALEPSGQGRT